MLLSWLVLSATLWITAKLLPGFEIRSPKGAIGVALIFGILNYLLGTVLYVALGVVTLFVGFIPIISFFTQATVVAVLLKVTDAISDALDIKRFRDAFLAGMILTLVTRLLERLT